MVLTSLLAIGPLGGAQLAATCTPNDVVGETDSDHTKPADQSQTDQVTNFDQIDIVTVCFQEDAEVLSVTMTVKTAPAPNVQTQSWSYTANFVNGTGGAKTCTYKIGSGAATTGDCTGTHSATTIQLKFPRALAGPPGSSVKDLVASTVGVFVPPAGSVVTSTDRAPNAGTLFPATAPYKMGSRGPADLDSDGDGSPDRTEIANGTDPGSVDSDRDGLLDGASQSVTPGSPQEANFTAANILQLTDGRYAGEAEFGSNATLPDTDGDGLLDGDDFRLPAGDPLGAYFQSAGVTPANTSQTEEVYLGEYQYRGDPTKRDTDDDGLDDVDEVLGRQNQKYPNGVFGGFPGSTYPDSPDGDNDKLPDGAEETGTWTAPNGTAYTFTATNPNAPDTDGDGISDYDEIVVHRIDPTKRDTDGDGATDDEELSQNTNPRDPNSHPVAGIQGSATDVSYLVISTVAMLVVIVLCIIGTLVRWG